MRRAPACSRNKNYFSAHYTSNVSLYVCGRTAAGVMDRANWNVCQRCYHELKYRVQAWIYHTHASIRVHARIWSRGLEPTNNRQDRDRDQLRRRRERHQMPFRPASLVWHLGIFAATTVGERTLPPLVTGITPVFVCPLTGTF